MQSASAGFAAAVESNSFSTDYRVTLMLMASSPVSGVMASYTDWTEVTESFSIDESIVTDSPDGTRLITGYPARVADLTLAYAKPFNARVSTKATAGWLLDPYNAASPLYRRDLTGWGIKIELGVVPHGGVVPEFITKFTGVIDTLSVDPESGTITVNCLDNRGKLSSAPSFPENAGENSAVESNGSKTRRWRGQGTTGLWPLDILLRSQNIDTVPPRFANSWIEASFHGTGSFDKAPANWFTRPRSYTEGNVIRTFEGADYTEFFQGQWCPQLGPMSFLWFQNGQDYNYPSPPPGTSYLVDESQKAGVGYSVQVEWFQQVSNVSKAGYSGTNPFAGILFYMDNGSAVKVVVEQTAPNVLQPKIFATGVGGTGVLPVFDTATMVNIGPTYTDAGGWHRFWFKIDFTSNTVCTFTLIVDNGAPVTTTVSDGTYPLCKPDIVIWQHWSPVEAMQSSQFTTIAAASTSAPNYTGWTPSAYFDKSIQNISAIPPNEEGNDAWGVIQRIVGAEGAYGGFDELGVFRTKNRQTLATQAPVRSVTSSKSLKTLSYDVSRANFRNRIRIPGDSFYSIGRQEVVWTLEEPLYLGPGQSYTRIVNIDAGPVVALGIGGAPRVPSTPVSNWSTGMGFNSELYFLYATSQFSDGTGDASFVNPSGVRVYARPIDSNTFKVVATNNSGKGVWFVVPTSLATAEYPSGTPGMWQIGCLGVASADGYVESIDSVSVGIYGEQYLLLDSNPWFQNPDHCQDYADDLLADMSEPKPILRNVKWVPDPRLQLTDRVTLLDPDVTTIAEDCLIIGMHWSMSNGDWDCSADLRTYSYPGGWVFGVAGRSEMGVTTYV